MRIAVVGAGISGLVAYYFLSRLHDVTLFEAARDPGGHTCTVTAGEGDAARAVDIGFIVFNDWTYPNFIRLLDQLGVDSQPSDMSFSVRCEETHLEYNGTSLNALFAQRRNLLRPWFYGLVREILRFNREAVRLAESAPADATLGDLLDGAGFSQRFRDLYLVPMGASIWSASPLSFLTMPARFFVRFFQNHGLLSVGDRPTWRTVRGGSRRYVERILATARGTVRAGTKIVSIERHDGHVTVSPAEGEPERFDQVIVATHADQALAMLRDPSPAEREILSAFPYQPNHTVLHHDTSLLPKRRLAWASWNYHRTEIPTDRVQITYNMNLLQSIPAPPHYCVTLNRNEPIDKRAVIHETTFHHPAFGVASIAAQARREEISGARRTFFCGAYWGSGFHEDGVNSGLAVARRLGAEL